MPPIVSILLPNLNNRPYLEERMRSIQFQTFTQWELIVVDSYSTDGSWEYFEECARNDSRIHLHRSDEKGIYVNFNKCIQLAKGEYIYFATGDDSMTPNLLQEMVQALQSHPQCDLAHCKLQIIDENNKISNQKAWDNFFIVQYFGPLIDKPHIRKAPHDGLLHFSGITVYTSLTQILIRRSLFQRIGMFLTTAGSIADYEWVMRATLTAHTVHVPSYLAFWRIHSRQATSDNMLEKAKAGGQFIKMAHHALRTANTISSFLPKFNTNELFYILKKEQLYYQLKFAKNKFTQYLIALKWFFCRPTLLKEYKKIAREKRNFVSQQDFLTYIKAMITRHNLHQNLIPIQEDTHDI